MIIKKTFSCSLVFIFVLLFFTVQAGAEAILVASVKTLKGEVSIIRENNEIPVQLGNDVFKNDTIKTGNDSAVGLVFLDDSLMSLGPESVLQVNQFEFEPAFNKLGFVSKIMKGTATYLSGIIGKLAPKSVKFETPHATLGLRGTHFAVMVEEEKEGKQ